MNAKSRCVSRFLSNVNFIVFEFASDQLILMGSDESCIFTIKHGVECEPYTHILCIVHRLEWMLLI